MPAEVVEDFGVPRIAAASVLDVEVKFAGSPRFMVDVGLIFVSVIGR
jgi:hypothetical protein